jgi:hypothetical protein
VGEWIWASFKAKDRDVRGECLNAVDFGYGCCTPRQHTCSVAERNERSGVTKEIGCRKMFGVSS